MPAAEPIPPSDGMDAREESRIGWMRRAAQSLALNRAVAYALSVRLWQFLAGPVTLAIIAARFSAAEQGFFYTFSSLLALQAFVELGLQTVILNLASHLWAGLNMNATGEIVGDSAAIGRLGSLSAMIARWYAWAAVLFVLGVGAGGTVFFGLSQSAETVAWIWPWVSLVLLAGLSLWLMPFAVLLEGCHQVTVVNKFRFVQAVCGNLGVWLAILAGMGLWAAVVSAAVRLASDVLLVGWTYRRFFAQLLKMAAPHALNWRKDIWPLQWTAAVQSVVVYFSTNLMIPVIFAYQGAAEAGRLGMTWTILTALQGAAQAWIQTRIPQFGALIARREYAELERLFQRAAIVSFVLLAVGGAAFCLVVLGLHGLADESNTAKYSMVWLASRIANRLLDPLATVLFTLFAVLWHIIQCEVIYVRAHRRDPFLRVSLIGHCISGALIWGLGSRFGALGVVSGLLVVECGLFLPVIHGLWRDCRADH